MADELVLTDQAEVAELAQLETLLQGAGVFGSMDPAEVNLPGYWLAVDEMRPHTMGGTLQLRCSVYLIAPDSSARRAMGVLAGLFNKIRTVLTPDGPVLTQGVVLPDSSTPLPALRVPVFLYTSESE